MEQQIRHLEMIQDVIKRMANNSYLLKGWAVTLVTGLFTLSNKDSCCYYLLSYIPILAFWFLDAYYLQQERLFRNLYDEVRKMDKEKFGEFKFSLSASVDKHTKKTKKLTYKKVLFSKTEAPFYISLLVFITIIIMMCFFM